MPSWKRTYLNIDEIEVSDDGSIKVKYSEQMKTFLDKDEKHFQQVYFSRFLNNWLTQMNPAENYGPVHLLRQNGRP